MSSSEHTAVLAGAEQQHVFHTLIQEAQQEIGRLRAELYSTSRLADERKQALDATTAAHDQLAAVAHQLEEKVQVMHSQLMQLPQLQHELKALQDQQQHLEKDRAVQLQARRILEAELQGERAARAAAEEARAKVEAERSRWQLGQDGASAQVRLLQQKVAEAEEEQLRAEEEAAQLRQELAVLQQQLTSGSTDNVGGGSMLDRAAEEGLRSAQLEAQAAKAEAAKLQQDLTVAKQQLQQAQQQVQGLLQQQQQQQHHKPQQQPLHTGTSAATQEHQLLAAELAACKAQMSDLQQALAAAQAEAAAARDAARQAEAAAATARRNTSQAMAPAAAATSADANGDSADAEGLQEQIELLMDKLVVLKKSRDKLLEQMDSQSIEMEQLLADHQAMANTAAEAKQECRSWQAQAQDSLATIQQLQQLLSEAATSAEAAQEVVPAQPFPDTVDAAAGQLESVAALKAKLLQQQAQATTLELQVKLLSMQLLRSYAAYNQARSSLLPVLSGVESRLLSLKARTTSLLTAA